MKMICIFLFICKEDKSFKMLTIEKQNQKRKEEKKVGKETLRI